jgi:uncharacterized protein YcnI
MKKTLLFVLVVLLVPSFASAHVSVRPRESKPDAEERYTVRVPTEGDVVTTHVVLEIPSDVVVLEVLPAEGTTFDVARQGSRITAITWRKEIAPKAAAEFVFRARNPKTTEIAWKAHQHFSDGSVADWIGPAGDRRPASVTKLSAAAAPAGGQQIADAAGVESWQRPYDVAFNATHWQLEDQALTHVEPFTPATDVALVNRLFRQQGWQNCARRSLRQPAETDQVRRCSMRLALDRQSTRRS